MKLDLTYRREKIYTTYVSSNAAWSQKEFRRPYRCNATKLDSIVVAAISEFLGNRGKLRRALRELGLFGNELEHLAIEGERAAQFIDQASPVQLREIFIAIILRIEVGHDELFFSFRGIELRRLLEWGKSAPFLGRPSDWSMSDTRYTFSVSVRAISTPKPAELHFAPVKDGASLNRNEPLIKLIADARRAQQLLEVNRNCSVQELAEMLGCKRAHFERLIGINYLAPDIVASILDGTQPASIDQALLLNSNIPTDWAVQRKQFGFSKPMRLLRSRLLYGRGHWPSSR